MEVYKVIPVPWCHHYQQSIHHRHTHTSTPQALWKSLRTVLSSLLHSIFTYRNRPPTFTQPKPIQSTHPRKCLVKFLEALAALLPLEQLAARTTFTHASTLEPTAIRPSTLGGFGLARSARTAKLAISIRLQLPPSLTKAKFGK